MVAGFPAAAALASCGVDAAAVRRIMPHVDPAAVPVKPAPVWLLRLWLPGIVGMAMPWGIYLHPGIYSDARSGQGPLIIHELMHVEQWRRHGTIGFLRRYLGDYLRNRFAGAGHHAAYEAIAAEAEARSAAAHLVGSS
jgi:hypothetical protein